MLSLTVNQVKVDAGPLITRFKDADTGELAYAGAFTQYVGGVSGLPCGCLICCSLSW